MSNPGPRALTADQIDNLGLALLEIAKEMWVMKDRQIVTEALLRERQLLPDLESYQPGPELTKRLAVERELFLNLFTSVLFEGRDFVT